MLDFEPVSRHPATVAVSGKFGPRPPRRGGSYESETGFVSGKCRPRHHDGAHHSEGKQPFVNEDEPPMDTNRHEDRWTSFNDNWRQNASALLSRWCDPVMGGSPPGSAGVPPAQILPQLQPPPSPESTGSGALPLLRPGPCGFRRQGGRLQHRRETERQPKGQHAGGTPALPGGVVPMVRWGVVRRATSLKAGLSPLGNSRLPASRAPAPRDWADPSRRTIN